MLSANSVFVSTQLIRQLKYFENKNQPGLSFETSKDHLLVPRLKQMFLHSKYYPLKEGKKIQIPTAADLSLLAIGLGAGYHLVEICQKTKVTAVCIDYQLLNTILSHIDLSRFFPPQNLQIISPDEIGQSFDFFKYRGYHCVIHPALQRIFPDKVLQTIQQIKKYLDPLLLEYNTQSHFGKIWFKSILKNIHRLIKQDFELKPLIIDKKPIVITGAGPSLDRQIEFLKKYRADIFIAASDTSLNILCEQNIMPDTVFSFDAHNSTYLHFLNQSNKPKDYRLLIDITSPVEIASLPTTPLFSNHPFTAFIKQHFFEPVLLPSGAQNIGGAMLHFFQNYFPQYPLITIGIDFSYYEFQAYAKYSYMSQYMLCHAHYFYTPDNYAGQVFYKNALIKLENQWKTNSLMQRYSENTGFTQAYTLSHSPVVNWQKLTDAEKIIARARQCSRGELTFNYTALQKERFLSLLFNQIDNDPSLFLSFFLHKKIRPEKKDLQELKKYIRNFFHSA